jgi:Mg2+ and Co2+ transporter CorA
MAKETINKICDQIKQLDTLDETKKNEMLELMGKLEKEVGSLSESKVEEAQTIANFAQSSTHEAIKKEKNPELQEISIKGLSSSVEDFEVSHPELVKVVNRIIIMLSNIGI